MIDLFAPPGRRALEALARSNALLAFDFDGTLAPIVEDRDAARMPASTESLLECLTTLFPCAVISGRARDDVAARLGRARVHHVIGNHGLEPGTDLEVLRAVVLRARRTLERAIQGWPGVEIEDKAFSLAVHYRHAPLAEQARDHVHAAIATLGAGVRLVPGKLVANVIPAYGPNKADALARVRLFERADAALYVGDDATDEDVFARSAADRVLGVRVGRAAASAAEYLLERQSDIDRLLEILVRSRLGQIAALG